MYVICVCCLVCIWTFSILMSWECRITYTHKTDHFLILRNRNVTAVAQEEGCFWLTLTLVSVPAEEASLKIYLKGRAVNLYAPSSVTDYNIAKPGELPSEKLQLEWVYPSCWHTFSWWLWVVCVFWVFWRGGGILLSFFMFFIVCFSLLLFGGGGVCCCKKCFCFCMYKKKQIQRQLLYLLCL